MKMVDLSAEIAPSPAGTPPFLKTELAYHDHAAGAAQARAILHVPPSLLRNDEGWATETITHLGTHDTTHVDAPWHYNSRIGGEDAPTVDQLPLDWFYHDGVVLDMRSKADGDAVTVEDVRAELARIEYALKPWDIVLMDTGRDKHYDAPDYMLRGPGVSAEATLWLWDQGIRVMGIDAWGWDAPLDRQARAAAEAMRKGVFWAAHQIDRPYVHLERLVNLGELPPHGFMVACFPLKIKGGSAGPCRAVAILP